jgi:electron transfer flavoprotein beta subunit
MKILVVVRMVPDVVEELEIAPDGKALDTEYLRRILSESDNHALEEAILLKERHGATITLLAPDAPEVDEALYSALAKGADRAIKVTGMEESLSTRATAALLAGIVRESGLLPADLILTGVQAIDDLDGLIAPLLAFHLGLPSLGIVTRLTVDEPRKTATAIREFAGGVRGEYEVSLPAVMGIQAAEKPPRYVPVAKVRVTMKTQKLETIEAPAAGGGGPALEVLEMKKCEPGGQAEMLEGPPEQVSGRLVELLEARGVL